MTDPRAMIRQLADPENWIMPNPPKGPHWPIWKSQRSGISDPAKLAAAILLALEAEAGR